MALTETLSSRRVLLGTGLLILFLSVLVAGMALFLHQDNYRFIREQIQEQFASRGYELYLGQDFSLQPGLQTSVIVQDLRLSNKSLPQDSLLLSAGKFSATFSLLPIIFQDSLQLQNLAVSDATINLSRNEDGTNNWSTGNPGETGGGSLKASIELVELSNVTLEYTGPTFTGKKLYLQSLKTGYLDDGTLVISDVSGELDGHRISARGKLDDPAGFVKGRGAVIDLDFRIDETMELGLSGELGADSLPTSKGLTLEMSGRNLAKWASILLPSVPVTESFSLAGSVVSIDDELRFNIDRASLQGQPGSVGLKGQVSKKSGQVLLDLQASGEGSDLRQLSAWLNAPADVKAFLPVTDRFAFNSRIRNEGGRVSASELDLGADLGGHSLEIAGDVADIKNLSGMDVEITATGDSLPAFRQAILPGLQLGFTIPQTDSYSIRSAIAGELGKPSARNLDFALNRGDNGVKVTGGIGDLAAFSGIALQVDMQGKDLQSAGSLVGFDLPPTSFYRINGKLEGNRQRLRFSRMETGISIASNEGGNGASNEILLKGNVNDLLKLEGLELSVETGGEDFAALASTVGMPAMAQGISHQLALGLAGSLQEPRIDNLRADLGIGDSALQLGGDIQDARKMAGISLEFNLEGNEADVARAAGLSTREPVALHFRGKLNGDLREFALDDFFYQGGNGHTSGNLAIDLEGKPSVTGQLGQTELVMVASGFEAVPVAREKEISLEWMDNLDVDLNYESLSIARNDARIRVLGGRFLMQDGLLDWNPFNMVYDDDLITGFVLIDAKSNLYRFAVQSEDLDMGKMLSDLGWFDRYVGKANVALYLETRGGTDRQLVANLGGKGKLLFKQGVVKKFGSSSVNYIKQLMPWRSNVDDLKLECIVTSTTLDRGVARIEHLFVDSKDMVITGGGSISLVDSKIDMALAPRAKQKNFLDANVSLFLTGSLAEPKAKVGKLSAVKDVGIKYGQWALLGPFALAVPRVYQKKFPSCEKVVEELGGW